MLVSRVDLHRFILPNGLYECKLHNLCIKTHTYSELRGSLTSRSKINARYDALTPKCYGCGPDKGI